MLKIATQFFYFVIFVLFAVKLFKCGALTCSPQKIRRRQKYLLILQNPLNTFPVNEQKEGLILVFPTAFLFGRTRLV